MEYWKEVENWNIEGEIWIDIPNFEGLYQASSLGRIRGLDRKIKCNANRYKKDMFKNVKGRVLKQRLDKYGYLQVSLVKDGVYHKKGVHRFILMAFKPTEGMEELTVNHIKGIKTLNFPEELEWATAKEQSEHAYKTGLINYNNTNRGETIGSSKLNNSDIVEIYENKNNLTMSELAKKYEVCVASIKNILDDKTWEHVTKNLVKNKTYYELTKEEVVFIFTNPLSLNNTELSLLFNKGKNLIRRIFRKERHSRHTEKLIPNELKDISKNLYKASSHKDVLYFTNINKLCEENKELNRIGITKSIKNNSDYKGWRFDYCNKSEYLNYLRIKYDEYIQNQSKSTCLEEE